MLVKDLIEDLKKYPEDEHVFIGLYDDPDTEDPVLYGIDLVSHSAKGLPFSVAVIVATEAPMHDEESGDFLRPGWPDSK